MDQWVIPFPAMENPDWNLLRRYAAFPEEERRLKKFMDAANEAFAIIQPFLNGCAVCSSYSHLMVCGDLLRIGNSVLRCPAFMGLQTEQILRAWVFFIRTDFKTVEKSIPMKVQVFVDLWGTIYLDICRKRLEEFLCSEAKKAKAQLSDCFGPGYYGMPPEEMRTIFSLSDPGSIQIQITQTGTLVPSKSSGGIYLALSETDGIHYVACANCRGDHRSCRYCKMYHSHHSGFDMR